MLFYGVAAGCVSGDHAVMSEYSATFLDHYERPRNLGDLEDAAAVALVRDDVCGDVMRLAISVEPGAGPERRIIAARFKAFGCAAAIAVGSVVSEWAVGRSLGEAAELEQGQIVAALDGVPPRRRHAVILGRAALRNAIDRLP